GAIDFYVSPSGQDGNPGTLASPFKTIDEASQVATPGTTIHVAPGVYTEVLETSASGTAAAPVAYVSSVTWGAKIRTEGPDDHWSWTNQGSYVHIVGFDVSGNGAGGIDNFGSNVQIVRNHVHDIPATGCTSNGGAGIAASNYENQNVFISRNLVHDIGEFPEPCSRVHGIYFSHEGGRIVNNIVFRVSGWGIHFWHAPLRITIANNLVFNNAKGGIGGGAGDSPYFDDPNKPADHIRVINNIVYDNKGIGIEELGITGTNNSYAHNLVFANQQDWSLQNGLSHSGTVGAPPGFVRYDSDGKGDYHLTADSPAIDRGMVVDMPAIDGGMARGAAMVDYDGVPRPQGHGMDIGPFEFVP
ncbi:MAG: choice-of-anchor Q domain-containing protein, partial [Kiloniellales bacterium]